MSDHSEQKITHVRTVLQSPYTVPVFTIVYLFWYKFTRMFYVFKKRYKENMFTYFARLLLLIPFIRRIYKSKMDKIYDTSQTKIRKQLLDYPEQIKEIPDRGLTSRGITKIINTYQNITANK